MAWQSDRMRSELKKLAKSTCANYGSNGICLISETECYVCRELTLEGQEPWRCRWFEDGVLPQDSRLEAEYRKALADYLGVELEEDSKTMTKECAMCGKDFKARSNRAQYCPQCKGQARKEAVRKRVKRHRAKM